MLPRQTSNVDAVGAERKSAGAKCCPECCPRGERVKAALGTKYVVYPTVLDLELNNNMLSNIWLLLGCPVD